MGKLRGLEEEEIELGDLETKSSGGKGGWVLFGLTLLAAGAGGFALMKSKGQVHAELEKTKAELMKVQAAFTEASSGRTQAEEELKARDEKVTSLEAAVAQKTAALVVKSTESETNSKLISELKSKLDAKDGEVSGDANHVVVNLVDQILFKSGEAELSPRGKDVLGKVGLVLKGLSDKQILIGGHTDNRPIHTDRFPSNWELSGARAINVVHYLADQAGVDPHRLAAAAYSEFHPSARSKAKNRRIEILLTPLVEVKREDKAEGRKHGKRDLAKVTKKHAKSR